MGAGSLATVLIAITVALFFVAARSLARLASAAAATVVLLALAAGHAASHVQLTGAVRRGEPEPFRMTATARYNNFSRFRPENVPTAVRREAERCRQADAFLITDANPYLLHHLLDVKAKALPTRWTTQPS